jgi:hypothetical protein
MDGFLIRCCAFGLFLESILLNQPLKIFFQQYRSLTDILRCPGHVCSYPESGHSRAPLSRLLCADIVEAARERRAKLQRSTDALKIDLDKLRFEANKVPNRQIAA